ncbi:CoA transferase [Dactylosporangium sp. NPDC000555]|uniref:CaiB/BaiF CoA transferase family protein n=1 Tax=Dactylosporangium sp. NPDC000555 TaxID=3154260 RepID=UPI003328D740
MTGAGLAPQRQVLSGITVLDLSRWASGEFAARLFGDFGADVIKVEKPAEGSLTRTWGPFPGDRPDPERSALFLHLNVNKRSIELDLHDEADRDVLLALVRRADVVVESFRPGHLERLRLGPAELHAVNPRLVLARITPFGQTGPYAGYEASGLTLQAMGWPIHATGQADRPPLRKPGLLEQYTIGRTSAAGALAGLLSARRTGTGAVLDLSGFEILLSGADRRAAFLLASSYSGANAPRGVQSPHRGGSAFTGKFEAADGHLQIYVTQKRFWLRLVALVADGDQAFLERFADSEPGGGSHAEEFAARLRAYVAARSKHEVMDRAQAMKIPVSAILDVSEVHALAHYRARGLFVRAEHPKAGPLEYVGQPWRMRGGYRLRRAAPTLGQHSAEIRDELAAATVAAAATEEMLT